MLRTAKPLDYCFVHACLSGSTGNSRCSRHRHVATGARWLPQSGQQVWQGCVTDMNVVILSLFRACNSVRNGAADPKDMILGDTKLCKWDVTSVCCQGSAAELQPAPLCCRNAARRQLLMIALGVSASSRMPLHFDASRRASPQQNEICERRNLQSSNNFVVRDLARRCNVHTLTSASTQHQCARRLLPLLPA